MSLAQYVNGALTRLEQLGLTGMVTISNACRLSDQNLARSTCSSIRSPSRRPRLNRLQRCRGRRHLLACLMISWPGRSANLSKWCSAGWGRGRGANSSWRLQRNKPASTWKELAPSSQKQGKLSQSGRVTFRLQEGQRKAVRAALMAGVTPRQVAKHFGLPLAAIGKVMDESTKA
jgi:hypothetical protein